MRESLASFLTVTLTLICLIISVTVLTDEKVIEARDPPEEKPTTLTIYDENNEIFYQYTGDIDVVGDSVIIHLPSTGCSCVDN